MPTEKKSSDRTTIITSIIAVVGTIAAAFLVSPWIPDFFKNNPPPPTPSPTPTASPQSNYIPPPLPLAEVFPQAGEGEQFTYNSSPLEPVKKNFKDENCRYSGLAGLKLTYRFTGGGYGGWGVAWRRTRAALSMLRNSII